MTPPEASVPVWGNRWMTLRALAWLLFLRAGLAVLPFRTLLSIQRRSSRVRPRQRPRPFVPRLARAVQRASRFLPGTETCLPEALAGQVLLARAGYHSELRIGVERPAGAPAGLAAHAWLECEGHVVIGEPEPGKYSVVEP